MKPWDQARRILAVRLDNLGDVLMTTPAIRALKDSFPGCDVTLLASRAGARAAAHIREVDHVIAYDAPWVKHPLPTRAHEDMAMCRTIGARRFDAAVIFTVYSQSALPAATFCHLAEIPLRLAYARENPYQLLTDWARETEPGPNIRHEVRRQLDLVAHVGARTADERLSFEVRPQALGRARAKLQAAGLDGSRPFLVVHPGATAASRRWAPERFARSAARLSALLDCEIVVTGDASERGLCDFVRQGAGRSARSFAGAVSLDEFAALIALSAMVVANNTSAVHLAAALGTPVVDLYALTNPQHTPWQVAHRVLSKDVPCRNCYKSACPEGHHACLDGVTVDDAVQAACELWRDVGWRAAA